MILKAHEFNLLNQLEQLRFKQLVPDLIQLANGDISSKLLGKVFPEIEFEQGVQAFKAALKAYQQPQSSLEQMAKNFRERLNEFNAVPAIKRLKREQRAAELAELAKHVPWAAAALANAR